MYSNIEFNRFVTGGFIKSRILTGVLSCLFLLWLPDMLSAQEGEPYIHDPSTITLCDGKSYTLVR